MNSKTTIISALLLLTLSVKMAWADEVHFITHEWDNTSKTLISQETSCSDYTVVTSGGSDQWVGIGDGYPGAGQWYVVTHDVTCKTLNVQGTANLILCDNATLTCSGGVKLEGSASLTIYSQSDGTACGQLYVTNSYSAAAGIGCAKNAEDNGDPIGMGALTIHGGIITARGSDYAAGIGGGENRGNSSLIAVYGGKVYAYGGKYGAGIGGGYGGSQNSAIAIYGGEVWADGGEDGAGIGGGRYTYGGAQGGELRVYGGIIVAKGLHYGAGIGGGYKGRGSTVYVYGGEVYADTNGYGGAAIGGGHSGTAGFLEIWGGKVRAASYIEGQAVGHGHEGTADLGSLHVFGGELTLYGNTTDKACESAIVGSEMMTYYVAYEGDWVLSGKADRKYWSEARSKDLYFAPCPHDNAEISYNDQGHVITCPSCYVEDSGRQPHQMEGRQCKVCDYRSALCLEDAEDNDATIAQTYQQTTDVMINGRQFLTDGSWNTLCLPFSVSTEGTIFKDAEVQQLVGATFADGTLTLNFQSAGTTLTAGMPYMVRWTSAPETPSAYSSPTFSQVTITSSAPSEVSIPGVVDFKGCYSPHAIAGEDKSLLYLSADSRLSYPAAAMSVNSFRAWFQLADGVTCGTPDGINAKAVVMHFDNGATTVLPLNATNPQQADHLWVDLSGRSLHRSTPRKGLYIINRKKVVIQ